MSGWIVKRGTLERQIPDTATLVRLARENRLKPTDLVFHPASQRWLNACEVPDIKYVFDALPRDGAVEAAEAAELPLESTAGQDTLAPPLSQAVPVSVNTVWGASSRILGVIAGAVAIFGGVTLLGLKAAGENSLIEALAHGIGIYCIGKGLFMIAGVGNAKAAVDFVAQQFTRRP